MGCSEHRWDCYCEDDRLWAEQGSSIELEWRMVCLGSNLENAAVMAAFGQARYAKGFTDGTLLREFCEDYVPEPYFPMADTRPAAERLGWPSL